MRLYIILLLSLLFVASSCAETEVTMQSIQQKYTQAIYYINTENYNQAKTGLTEITTNYPETKYANYAYLKLGDIAMQAGSSNEDIKTAETNYKIFLHHNPSSHLVPYVISKLIELNYKKTNNALFQFGESYTHSTSAFKNIVNEYQRFRLMYPYNVYLKDSLPYLDLAQKALSEHERTVGDWYYQNELYSASVARYLYLLNNYPTYKNKKQIVQKLILAYTKNKQLKQAKDWQYFLQKQNTTPDESK